MDAAIRDLVQNFLNNCRVVDYPYFVLSTNQPIEFGQVTAFGTQLTRSYLELNAAFHGPNPRAARQQTAAQTFFDSAPPGDTRLFLVIDVPDPNFDVLRFPLRHFFTLFDTLRAHPVRQATLVIRVLFAQIPLSVVNYADPNFEPQIPPLPRNPHRAMAQLTMVPTLPTFSGVNPDEDVDVFFARMHRIFACYDDITPAQKLVYLETQCRGPALSVVHEQLKWLEANPNDPAPPHAPLSIAQKYENVRQKLINSFRTIPDIEYFRDQLNSRCKLETESFQAYMESVISLCNKAGIATPDDRLKHLLKGLPWSIAAVLRPNDLTMETFLTRVLEVDNIHRASIRARSLRALQTNSFANSPLNAPLFGAPTPDSLRLKTEPQNSCPKTEPAASVALDSLVSRLEALLSMPPAPTASAFYDARATPGHTLSFPADNLLAGVQDFINRLNALLPPVSDSPRVCPAKTREKDEDIDDAEVDESPRRGPRGPPDQKKSNKN